MTTARINIALGLLLLLLGILYLVNALAIRMPMLSDVLGPRLLPVALGWLLIGGSAGLLVQSLVGRHGETDDQSPGAGRAFLLAMSAMVAAVLLLSVAGYLVFAFIVVFSVFSVVGYLNPLPRLAAAAVMALIFHAVFVWILGVPFPELGDLMR